MDVYSIHKESLKRNILKGVSIVSGVLAPFSFLCFGFFFSQQFVLYDQNTNKANKLKIKH